MKKVGGPSCLSTWDLGESYEKYERNAYWKEFYPGGLGSKKWCERCIGTF